MSYTYRSFREVRQAAAWMAGNELRNRLLADARERVIAPTACKAKAETGFFDVPPLPDIIEAAIAFGRDRDWWTDEEFKAGDATVRYHPHIRDDEGRRRGISDSDIAGMLHRCARFEGASGDRFRLVIAARCAACQRTTKPQGS